MADRTPAKSAAMDQAIEEAIDATVLAAAALDHLDMLDAMPFMARGLLLNGLGLEDAAMAIAGLALRLHRGQGGDPRG